MHKHRHRYTVVASIRVMIGYIMIGRAQRLEKKYREFFIVQEGLLNALIKLTVNF